ncbi:MAG: ferritin-like domain-containing protein [Acidimicrobiales bacterium]
MTQPTESTNASTILERVASRRGFLLGAAGAAGAVGLLAACGSDDDASSSTTTGGDDSTTTTAADDTTTTAAPDGAGDLKVGAFAASLEVLAVNTYGAALKAAGDGALGDVPPAVGEFVTTAQEHHQAALDAWNKVLEDAGEAAVTDPPADLEKTVNDAFGKVTDVTGAAELALMLEQIAAATYLAAIPELATKPAIGLASSIQPIDMQHAAILLFVLGEYPVPDIFASPEMAATPA